MTGAAHLASGAAQRAGAGMVALSSPGVDPSAPPEVVRHRLPAFDWAGAVLADLHRYHALVIGPGLGRDDYVVAAVRAAVVDAELPVVVDGDGLFAMAWNPDGAVPLLRRRRDATVLTPHDGEYGLLTGHRPPADRIAAARDLAMDTRSVVLLKGPTTVVAAPAGDVRVINTGDARLATAGTGDVLAGIIGALLASGMAALEATSAGGLDPRRGGAPRSGRRTRRRRPADGAARRAGAAGSSPVIAVGPAERWAWAEVDLDAIAHNVGVVAAGVRSGGGVGRRQGRRLRARGAARGAHA